MQRKRIHIVQNAFLPDLLKGLEARGENIRFFIGNSYRNKLDLFNREKHIPALMQKDILEDIDKKVGVKNLTVEMNEYLRINSMGAIINHLCHLPTLLDCCNLIIKFQKYFRSDYNIRLCIQGPVSRYSVKINMHSCKGKSILDDIEILQIIDAMQIFIGADYIPIEIGITADKINGIYPLLPKGNYSVRTSQIESWVIFDTKYLFRKPPNNAIEENLYTLPNVNHNLSSKISYLLESFHSGFVPKLYEMASILDVSARTLERTLGKEGTTYLKLKQKYQLRKSIELICAQDLSIKKIAECLDFSNSQNFIRFFRTEFGQSPKQLRDNL